MVALSVVCSALLGCAGLAGGVGVAAVDGLVQIDTSVVRRKRPLLPTGEISLAGGVAPLSRQPRPERVCPAQAENGLWLWADDLDLPGDSMTARRLIPRIVGRFAFRSVTTEGLGPVKIVTDGELTVRRGPAGQAGRRSGEPLEATLRIERRGPAHEGLRAVNPPEQRHWRGWLTLPDSLEFHEVRAGAPAGAYQLDGWRLFYTVLEIDSAGTLAGRFKDGNYIVLGAPSPVGTLAERESGYFCAWRR